MFLKERKVLDNIAEEIEASPLFAERVEEIVVFGSRVRGDYKGESDFDVLVIVKDKDIKTETAIIKYFGTKEDQTGIPFAPVIKDWKVLDNERLYRTGFARAIEEEGVIIYRKRT
ncbi:MAG: nucleotidyltransferase domain-containing protein [Nitrospirae bacterium]|nr:nucleotidyltransferase domain-containing protein [Nitrospirota bacterium]